MNQYHAYKTKSLSIMTINSQHAWVINALNYRAGSFLRNHLYLWLQMYLNCSILNENMHELHKHINRIISEKIGIKVLISLSSCSLCHWALEHLIGESSDYNNTVQRSYCIWDTAFEIQRMDQRKGKIWPLNLNCSQHMYMCTICKNITK